MKNRVFTTAILLAIIAAAGAWAQNLPGNIWSSPQSTTTEGRYRSNADNFIRPDQYSGVRFDKWFGLASFLFDDNYSPIATAGFATKVNDIYIGAFYTGNFWAGAPANNYTAQQFTTPPAGGAADKTYNVYNTISTVPNPVNNAAVLIGVADMGFRLTWRTNYQSFNKSDIVTGNQVYKNYQSEEGYITPQIAWAMAKDLTGNGIRPYAALDLAFAHNYRKVETNGPDSASVTGSNVIRSQNHFDPSLSAGLGGYTFYNKNGFRGSFDADYVLTLNIYDNEYSYNDGGTYKTKKIKGTNSPGLIPLVEQSYVSNLLTPSLSGSWSEDRLALRFKLNLPLTLTSEESSTMDLDSSNNLIKNGFNDASTIFIFRPDLRLALQYKIIPSKLTLNAGARIQTTAIYLKTIDRAYYNSGSKGATSTVHDNSFGGNQQSGSFASRFHLGLTYNMTDNAWVEATTGVTNAYGNDAIEIFAAGGLFSFGSILVGLKF